MNREERRKILEEQGLLNHFSTIYADPPHPKGQRGKRGASQYYDLMTQSQMENMPIADLAAENAHLYMWVTNGSIPEGIKLMEAWGFSFKNIFTWVKSGNELSLGAYFRNNTENVLFGVRGSAPVKFKAQPNWMFAPRQDHSHKPEEMFSVIERMSPGPYLELFARRQPTSTHPEAWSVWGNEIESDLYIPDYPVPKYSDKVVLPDIKEELLYGQPT